MVNLIHATWFDPTPDPEAIELELENFFHETALEVIPVEIQQASIRGASMSRHSARPDSRGDCRDRDDPANGHLAANSGPAARVGIVRSRRAGTGRLRRPPAARMSCAMNRSSKPKPGLDSFLLRHFENLATRSGQASVDHQLAPLHTGRRIAVSPAAARSDATLLPVSNFAGPAHLRRDPGGRSGADPVFESEASHVLWYNSERRQEQWLNGLFAANSVPCVHVIRSFEDSLLAAFAADAGEKAQTRIEMRVASPGSPNFAEVILGVGAVSEADPAWQEFLGIAGVTVLIAGFDKSQPVMAFLNERHELMQTFEQLRNNSEIPAGFQRLIDQHFNRERPKRNEILLNRDHDLVRRCWPRR